MATSIYIYEDEGQYFKFYAGKEKDIVNQIPIIDMYLKPHDIPDLPPKLWVVTKMTGKARPEMHRSMVHFTDGLSGIINEYISNDVIVVTHDSVKFNPKKMEIEFFPKLLRKAKLVMHVDRYVGNDIKRSILVDYDKRMFDPTRDRMNFILKVSS